MKPEELPDFRLILYLLTLSPKKKERKRKKRKKRKERTKKRRKEGKASDLFLLKEKLF